MSRLALGKMSLAYAFTSDVPTSEMNERFKGIGDAEFSYLLIEVAQVVAGYYERSGFEWMYRNR